MLYYVSCEVFERPIVSHVIAQLRLESARYYNYYLLL